LIQNFRKDIETKQDFLKSGTEPLSMKCIKVNAVFELVALIQKDIDAEQGQPDFIAF